MENIEDNKVRKETISKLKFFVHDLWKEQNLVDISAPSYITLNTKIQKPDTLDSVIKKIKQINLITSYNVKEFDKNSAKIKIKYLGKVKILENALIENGFILKILDNEWNLSLRS